MPGRAGTWREGQSRVLVNVVRGNWARPGGHKVAQMARAGKLRRAWNDRSAAGLLELLPRGGYHLEDQGELVAGEVVTMAAVLDAALHRACPYLAFSAVGAFLALHQAL